MTDQNPLEPTLATPAARTGTLSAPLVIGRYQVVRELGRGAMGVVFLADDTLLGRKVALKSVGAAPDGTLARHVTAEARAIARLQHPNVVGLHDVLQHDGQAYLAMEYVEGSDLQRWLAGTWTPEQRLRLFLQIAQGLEAAHDAGVVHRDFKPANVLVGTDGRARVSDFGLAALHGEQDAVERGSLVGTPAYMAPEQWAGKLAGPAADQFSFCVSLFEALTGRRPHQGQDLATLEAEVKRGPPPMPETLPHGLGNVLQRGLAVDPLARFGSMRELRVALEGALVRPVDRRRPLVVAAAGLLLLGGAGFTWHRAADPCRLESTRFDTVRSSRAATSPGLRAALDTTLDAWAETFTVECRRRGREAQWDRTRGCLEAVLDDVESVSNAAALAGAGRPVDSLLQYVGSPRACAHPANPPRPALPADPGARQKVAEALAALVDVVGLDGANTRSEQRRRAEAAVELAVSSGHAQTHARALAARARIEFNLGLEEAAWASVERGRTAALSAGALHEVVRLGLIEAFVPCSRAKPEECGRVLDALQPMVDALDHPWLRAWMQELRPEANATRETRPAALERSVETWRAIPGASIELSRAQRGLAAALRDGRKFEPAVALVDSLLPKDRSAFGLQELELSLIRADSLARLGRGDEALAQWRHVRETATRLKLELARSASIEAEVTFLLRVLGRAEDALHLIEEEPPSIYLELLRVDALLELGRVSEAAALLHRLEYPLVQVDQLPGARPQLEVLRLLVALEKNEPEVLERARQTTDDPRLLAACLARRGRRAEAVDVLRLGAEQDWDAALILALAEGRWTALSALLETDANEGLPNPAFIETLRAASAAMLAEGALTSAACSAYRTRRDAVGSRQRLALYSNELEWLDLALRSRCP